MSDKRLLVVSQHYFPENFRINDIVAGFVEDGYKVDVLCGVPNYPEGEWFPGYSSSGPKYEEQNSVRIFRSGEVRRKGNTSVRIFLNYVSWPITAFFRVSRISGTYDAVFCYNTSPVLMCIPAIRASRRFNAPLITYVLDLWPENLYSVLNVKSKLLRNIAYKMSTRLYNRADKLIALSHSLKERLEERVGDNDIPVFVVPQHAEDFYASPLSDEDLQNRFENKTVLLFAGNFSPAQNIEGIVRATKKAYDSGFEDVHLLLVGSGMSQKSIEKTINEEEAEAFVTLFGRVEATDIPKFTTLAHATVVSLSAHDDFKLAMPAKVASCMAAGKPIIASLTGEGARAIIESQCGFVAPAGDENELCKCFLQFASLDELSRRAMGENAQDAYMKNYSRRAVIETLEEIIFQ